MTLALLRDDAIEKAAEAIYLAWWEDGEPDESVRWENLEPDDVDRAAAIKAATAAIGAAVQVLPLRISPDLAVTGQTTVSGTLKVSPGDVSVAIARMTAAGESAQQSSADLHRLLTDLEDKDN